MEPELDATTETVDATDNESTRVNVDSAVRTKQRKARRAAVPTGPEVRFFSAETMEVRSSSDSDEIVFTGMPIVYDAPYKVRDALGEFEERMRPGVARNVMGGDTRALFNHSGMPIARTKAGTMALQDTPEGLTFTARCDARHSLVNDLAIACERGDIDQMSIGFIITPGGDEWDSTLTERQVTTFQSLPDISLVTYPCSPTTHVEVAQRMLLEMPIESRARMREIYTELRAGKVLSDANQSQLINAVSALHEILSSAGYDPSADDDEDVVDDVVVDEDGTEDGPDTEDGDPIDWRKKIETELELLKLRVPR